MSAPQENSIERREFMSRLGSAVLVSAGLLSLPAIRAIPRAEGSTGIYLRPPGAGPEKEFLSKCIRCGACALVCHPACIKLFDRTPELQDTPYIKPAAKACELCMKCVKVCPSNALVDIPVADVKMGKAVLNKDLCLSHRGQGVCEVCFQLCPRKGKAITQELLRLKPIYHSEHCTGCGKCEEVCPVRKKAVHVIPEKAKIKKAGLKGFELS